MRCFLVPHMIADRDVEVQYDFDPDDPNGDNSVLRIWYTINQRQLHDLWTRDGGLSEEVRNASQQK